MQLRVLLTRLDEPISRCPTELYARRNAANAPRDDVVRRIRALADLIERELPETVWNEVPHRWSTVSVLLLARIAGQGRTVATMLEAGHELDARMVMRSTFEHLTLLAWMAIDPSKLPSEATTVRGWRARNPQDNALWWVADQTRRHQRRREKQHVLIGDMLDDEVKKSIRVAKKLLEEPRSWGELPSVEQMATEVDECWGGRLPGWARAEPREPAFPFTVRGLYWMLHTAGSSSTHPGLGVLLGTFIEEVPEDAHVGRVTPERKGEKVDPFGSITAYLLLYAVGIAQHVRGGPDVDEALHLLGRFDDVRGPDLLLECSETLLGGRDGRRYGRANGQPLSIERRDGIRTFVVIETRGWLRLRHESGPTWTWDGYELDPVACGPLQLTGPVTQCIRTIRELLQLAEWAETDRDRPEEWPDGAP